MAKQVITEQTVLAAAKKGERKIIADPGTLITDAARERAERYQVKIEVRSSAGGTAPPPPREIGGERKDVVALGSDHGGFLLKEALKLFLPTLGYSIIDVGTTSEESCDYPDFSYAVARMVASGGASKGIMVDSVGIASAIVANKIPGIRAASCPDEFSARSSREHNDANVLTLGGKTIGVEMAKAVVKVWLATPFQGGRHQKRIDKIHDLERKITKP